MNMNMCIVIDMNIYIAPELEPKLRQEPSMSGLINHLLKVHYEMLPREIAFGGSRASSKIMKHLDKTLSEGMGIEPEKKAPWREKIEKPFVDAGMVNPSPEKIASDPSGVEGVFNTPEDIILKDEQWEEKYTDGELPCCKQKTRCKHWEWDGATLEYVNALSGKRKIAE